MPEARVPTKEEKQKRIEKYRAEVVRYQKLSKLGELWGPINEYAENSLAEIDGILDQFDSINHDAFPLVMAANLSRRRELMFLKDLPKKSERGIVMLEEEIAKLTKEISDAENPAPSVRTPIPLTPRRSVRRGA